MNKQRSKDYRQRIDQALATPKLQEALHQFGDAFLLSREKAFAGLDFEALRGDIAAMKTGVRENHSVLLEQFIANAEAAGTIIYRAKTAEDANRYIADLAKHFNLVFKKATIFKESDVDEKLKDALLWPLSI